MNRDELLRTAVRETVTSLQRRILAEHRDSDAVVRLARLRRAVTSEPGSAPQVWADTLGALPDELIPSGKWSDGSPTDYERAAHEAVTLFAVHQQSRSTAAHQTGISLGAAARRLAKATGRDESVRARFQAVATAESAAGVSYHLRSLITLLRAEGIPLDYSQLAVDLRQLHGRNGADRVRLRWGRDFHRAVSDDAGTFPESPQEPPSEQRSEEHE